MSGRRLDAVVRVRTLREQLARGEVSRRRAALAARERDEAMAWAAIRHNDGRTQFDARLFTGRRAMLGVGVREADSAGEATGVARHDLDHASDHWQDTARRLDGIERLVERITAETAAEQQRVDANELDDLVVMRWDQTRHGGGS